MGEQRKGLDPIKGIPGSLSELFRSLHYRRESCRRIERWARSSWAAIEFGRGNVELLDFLAQLNQPPSDSFAEQIFRGGEHLVRSAVVKVLQDALSKSGSPVGETFVNQCDKLLFEGEEENLAEEEIVKYLPVGGVLRRMERSLLELESKGFASLEDVEPHEVLEEFLANPLQMSS